jgi:hypothetical protein
MQISRRNLLKGAAGLAAATAVPALGADKTWTPKPLPPAIQQNMEEARRFLLTPDIIVREMLRCLDKYNEIPVGLLEQPGFDRRLGDLVRVHGHPPGMLRWQKSVCWRTVSEDLLLSIDDYSDQFIQPHAKAFTSDMLAIAKLEELGQGVMVMGQLPRNDQSYEQFSARANWRGYFARLVREYDIEIDTILMRFDFLYGFAQAS